MEDSKIIELFLERSESAIYELSKKYGRLFASLANNILGNELDAEECVNDTYLGVWNSIPPKRPEFLGGYACKIIRNIAIARYHTNTAEKRNSLYDVSLDELENCFASAENVEGEYISKLTAEAINSFLRGLADDDRVMFVKRYYYSESVGDIALEMGTKAHNVSVKLSRIREKLKKYLVKEGIYL